MSQQEASADGIMDLSTLSLNDMNFDSPLLSQSFNFGSSDLPTTAVPHPHLISTPYVSRQQLKPQFTSVVSPICQQQCARVEGDDNNNNVVVETNNNLTFNSPPIIPPSIQNAGLQATFDQPKMLEATFDQPQMQATFDQPKMLEATFDQPQMQATFDQPKMLEATFDQPQMQATFDQPKMLEATFDQPQMQATFDKPQLQATFDQPQLQATFDQPKMLEATFDKPKMAAAGSTTFDRPQLQETFDKPNMLEATFDQPTASTTFDRKLQATLENGGELMENSPAAAGGQISFEQQLLELTDEQQSSMKFTNIKGDDDFLMPPPLSNDQPTTDGGTQPSTCDAGQPLSPSNATFQMDTSPLTIHQQAPINPTSTSTNDNTCGDAPTSTSTDDNSPACGDGPNSTFRMEAPLFNSTTGQKETSAITKPSSSSLVGKPTATNKLNNTRTMTSTSSKTLSKPTTIAKPTLKKFVPLSQRSTISATTSHKQQTKKIGGSSLLRPSSGLVAKKSGLRAPASGSSGAANTHRNQQDLKSGVSSAVVSSSSSLLTNKTTTTGGKTTKLQQKSSITSSISKTTSSPAPSSGYHHASSSVDKKPSTTTGGDKATGIGLQRKIAATRSMKAPSTTSSRLLNGKTSVSSSSGLRAPVTSSLKSKVTSSSINVSSISNRSNISNKSTTSSTTTSSNRKTSSTLSKPPSSRQSVYGRNKPTTTTSSRYGQVKKSPSPTFNTIDTQTDDDPHALTGPEANNLRRELEELRQTSYAKQAEYDNEREELKGNISELKNDLENLKNNFEEEYERLQEKYKEEVEKNENLQIQLEDEQAKVTEFEVKLHKMVEPKLKELLKPYENTYEECQSLKSVLDIKSEEIRKLQTQLAQQRLKLSTNTNLENQMEKLKHQKEGIDAQLQRLQHEYLLTREELEREKLQNSLQERRNDELTREVEEMSFRLNSPQSNPPQSPFNPVFTVSTSNNNNLGESRVVKRLDMNVSGKRRSDATS